MSVMPEVKCRRCGESFSALRSRCPNCGTRRVTQSARTPGTTPGTVRGTASYERAETNTKWQMIFGLILVAAVILAVIVMVSTSLNGIDNPSSVKTKPTQAVVTDAMPTMEAPPTPPPTPTPTVDSIKIFNYQNEIKTDFTMHLSQNEVVNLQATAYPVDQFTDARFTWKSGDPTLLKVTPSDDTQSCVVEILGTKAGGVTLTCGCNGTEVTLIVYLVN